MRIKLRGQYYSLTNLETPKSILALRVFHFLINVVKTILKLYQIVKPIIYIRQSAA